MATTFVTLQERVLGHQFSPDKYRDYVKDMLNQGQRYIFRQTDVRAQMAVQTYATTAGAGTLTLPTDFARIISLRDTDFDDALAPIELRDFDEAGDSSGRPTSYVIVSNLVNLYPTPDAPYNLSLRYYKMPVEMSADGDVPALPEDYTELLVHYTLSRTFQREHDYSASSFHREEFERDLMKLRTEAQYDIADGPTQVPGTFEESTPGNFWY